MMLSTAKAFVIASTEGYQTGNNGLESRAHEI